MQMCLGCCCRASVKLWCTKGLCSLVTELLQVGLQGMRAPQHNGPLWPLAATHTQVLAKQCFTNRRVEQCFTRGIASPSRMKYCFILQGQVLHHQSPLMDYFTLEGEAVLQPGGVA